MENLTVQQEKAIALMQYKGEDFFIIQLEDEAKIYEGNEEDARAEFLADIEGTEEADIDINFDVYCSNNLTEVEEYDEDNYNNDLNGFNLFLSISLVGIAHNFYSGCLALNSIHHINYTE